MHQFLTMRGERVKGLTIIVAKNYSVQTIEAKEVEEVPRE
jgi:hypothetical protein